MINKTILTATPDQVDVIGAHLTEIQKTVVKTARLLKKNLLVEVTSITEPEEIKNLMTGLAVDHKGD